MTGFLTALFVGVLALWIGYRVGYRRGDSDSMRRLAFGMLEAGVELTPPTRVTDEALREATARGAEALARDIAAGRHRPLPKDRRVA